MASSRAPQGAAVDIEDAVDRATRYRKFEKNRVGPHLVGCVSSNRAGLGISFKQVHNVCAEMMAYHHVRLVQVPEPLSSESKRVIKARCDGDALLPVYSPAFEPEMKSGVQPRHSKPCAAVSHTLSIISEAETMAVVYDAVTKPKDKEYQRACVVNDPKGEEFLKQKMNKYPLAIEEWHHIPDAKVEGPKEVEKTVSQVFSKQCFLQGEDVSSDLTEQHIFDRLSITNLGSLVLAYVNVVTDPIVDAEGTRVKEELDSETGGVQPSSSSISSPNEHVWMEGILIKLKLPFAHVQVSVPDTAGGGHSKKRRVIKIFQIHETNLRAIDKSDSPPPAKKKAMEHPVQEPVGWCRWCFTMSIRQWVEPLVP